MIAHSGQRMVGGGDPETGPEIESTIVDVDSVGAGGACTTSTTSAGPSTSVVHVNVPIVNVSPTRRTMEAGKLTIWLTIESACTPLPGAPLSMRCGWQSTDVYANDSRLSAEVHKTMI
jgi:hypothetical protein